MATNNASVRVRMYRQGLGDCFLLTFEEGQAARFNMLIDCGLLQGTEKGKEIMQQVVTDIETTLRTENGGNAKLDAVVLTHEHADHISGFTQAKDVFDNIEFGEVWAAWMDDEGHPKYKLVRERFHKQVAGLQAALTQMNAAGQADLKEAVEHLINDFFDENVLGATKKGKRSPAWEYALSKSTNPPRFFTPGTMLSLPGFDDVRIYVLGPSEDFASFTKVNPPEDDTYRSEGPGFALMDSFFAAVGADDDDEGSSSEFFQPFDRPLRILIPDAEKDEFFKTHYGFGPPIKDAWRQINDDWLSLAGGLALNLDSYTNNTCLAFAIEFVSSRKVLLFPGDAQFSNWLSWQKVTWEVPDSNGVKQKVTAKDLLERTILYKVGHHGSHNATLKKNGLEMMTSPDLIAMIPVDRAKAKSKTSKTNPKGWEMPEKNLYNRLLERARGRVVLADESGVDELKSRCKDQNFVGKVKYGGSLNRTQTPGAPPEPIYVELVIQG